MALPEIRGDLGRVVVAHKSLGRPLDPNWGNTDYLATIGRRVLPLVVADVLARQRPLLDCVELEAAIEAKLNHDNYDEWVDAFSLRDAIFYAPEAKATLREPVETSTLLHSWVGAVYLQDGFSGVLWWLGPRIDASFDPTNVQEQALKRMRSEPGSPPPPIDIPPPIPGSPVTSTSAPSQAQFLPAFNQAASQRHLSVEYKTAMSGQSHNPQWKAECFVNGVSKGVGVGPSKQFAKEQAAKAAWVGMGWAESM